MRLSSRAPLGLLAWTLALAATRAQTASAPPPVPDSELPAVTLDTFNVSARKVSSYQAESVQMGAFRDLDPTNVPLSIDVLTREALDAQNARGLYDALRNVPGVTEAQITTSAYSNLAIRGIVVENRGNYRLNGSLPIINLADISLENKERVEVLEGTSSLYYGFVPPSGVINLVTKRPTPNPIDDFTFNANSAGGFGGTMDVSRSAGSEQQVGVRINAADDRERTGIDAYGGHRDFASAAVDLRPVRNLALRFDYEHLDKDVTEQTAITLPAAVNGVITLPPLVPNSRNLGSSWLRYNAFMSNWWARADYVITPEWTVFFETGNARTHRDRDYSQFTLANVATGAGTLSEQFYPGQDYRNSNYRLETYGRFMLGPVRNDVSVGLTGNDRKSDAPSQGSVSVAQNYYDPTPTPVATPPTATITHVPTRILDYAYYATDRLSAWNERVQAIVGGRDTEYISTTATTNYVVKNKFDPLLSAVAKPTADSSLYFSYLKGLEAGGNAPANTANAGSILPPLTSTQYEAGVKDKVFSGLLLQTSVFQIERPSTFIDPATNLFVANGLARFRGLAVFASGELTKSLSLIASAQDLDARQTKALNATTLDKIPEGTARLTESLFAEWRTPVANLSLSAGTYFVGRRPVNSSDQAFAGGYTTYSAGLSYQWKLGSVRYLVRVTGDNLTDKNAWAAVGSSLLGTTAPRLVKCSVTARF